MLIDDPVYGTVDVTEPVLVELMNSPQMQRLKGVMQAGFVPETVVDDTMNFSRYEHSIGVMLLLKRLKAPIEEQIAGLLHDSSHTAFSHTVDWAFGDPRKSDFQDKRLEEYVKNSKLGEIISAHGFDVHEISGAESNGKYGLLERDAPDLCADRVDYTLREGTVSQKEDVARCLTDLTVFKDEIMFNSREGASLFGNMYLRFQATNWASPDHMLRFLLLANALKEAARKGILTHDQLYCTDAEAVEILKRSKDAEILRLVERSAGPLKFEVSEQGTMLLNGKLRYVDPKFLDNGTPVRLSTVDTKFKSTLDAEFRRMAKPIRVKLL